MSSVIVHIGRDAVHLVSDTAVVRTSGALANFMSKVQIVPHANMAIAVRGHICALPIASVHLQRAGSTFNEIRQNAARALEPLYSQMDPVLLKSIEESAATHDVEVTVAGISETRGPMAYAMRIEKKGSKLDFTIDELEGDDAMFGPFTPEIEAEFERQCAAAGGDRVSQLEWLIDRTRRIQSPVFGRGESLAQTGGHAVLTKISAGRIETKILKSWPDDIGHRIACQAR